MEIKVALPVFLRCPLSRIEQEVRFMKLDVSILVLCTTCLLSLSSVSCEQAPPKYGDSSLAQNDAFATQKQMYDAGLLQIGPVQEPVGGSVVVIIPTDERLLERWLKSGRKPPADQHDYLVEYSKNELLTMVKALRKRSLFDNVRLRQSDNPDQVSFDEDFALINPANRIREWLVMMREPMAQRTIKVQALDLKMSYSQWFSRWLDSVEEAAKNLKVAAKE